jgi:hypothetical protein
METLTMNRKERARMTVMKGVGRRAADAGDARPGEVGAGHRVIEMGVVER